MGESDLRRAWETTLGGVPRIQTISAAISSLLSQDEDQWPTVKGAAPEEWLVIDSSSSALSLFWLKVGKPNTNIPFFLLILVLKGQLLILNIFCHGGRCHP